MSSSRTPPEARSNPKGSPALSTPPSALEDAGSPHQPTYRNPTPNANGKSNPSGLPPPKPNPQDPTSSTLDQRAHLSRDAMTARFGGPPPRTAPTVTAAQAEAYRRSVPALPALTKWSKWIGVFSWVSCAGVGTYMVLFMPLGDKETIFHPVRRKVFGIFDRLNGTYDEGKVQAELAKANADWQAMEVRQQEILEKRRAEGKMPSLRG